MLLLSLRYLGPSGLSAVIEARIASLAAWTCAAVGLDVPRTVVAAEAAKNRRTMAAFMLMSSWGDLGVWVLVGRGFYVPIPESTQGRANGKTLDAASKQKIFLEDAQVRNVR